MKHGQLLCLFGGKLIDIQSITPHMRAVGGNMHCPQLVVLQTGFCVWLCSCPQAQGTHNHTAVLMHALIHTAVHTCDCAHAHICLYQQCPAVCLGVLPLHILVPDLGALGFTCMDCFLAPNLPCAGEQGVFVCLVAHIHYMCADLLVAYAP